MPEPPSVPDEPRSPIVVLYGVTPNYPDEPKTPGYPPGTGGTFVYACPGGWNDQMTSIKVYSVQMPKDGDCGGTSNA